MPNAPWRDDRYPDGVPCHALLSADEIRYLHWVAGRSDGPGGALIDLGAYLGGSSYALARGSATMPAPPRLHAFDVFKIAKPGRRNGEHAESYADLYRENLSPYLDRIEMHPGYIAEWLAGDDAVSAVYPERAPISVLFIDCAKWWGVHHTVLHAFGQSLREGSVVVQQDFRSVQIYLALHMYQLRAVLEPAHLIDGGSVGFLAKGPIPQPLLDELWKPEDVEALGFDRTVDRVASWYDETAPEPLSAWVWLSAAGHRANTGDAPHTLRCIDRAMACVSRLAGALPDASRWRVHSELWTGEMRRVAYLLRRNGHPGVADQIVRMSTWGVVSMRSSNYETDELLNVWHDVADRCRARGWTRLALYGAGRHTQKLIAAGFPEDQGVEIVAILDDDPARAGHTLRGIPIVPAEKLGKAEADVVLPSSDAHESALYPRCEALATDRQAAAMRVYTTA